VARPQDEFLGSASQLVRTSSARLRRNHWTVQATKSGTSREGTRAVSIKTTMDELAQYMRGWRGYSASAKRLRCDRSHSLGPLGDCGPPSGANGKNTTASASGTNRAGSLGELRNHGCSCVTLHLARSKALSVGLSNAHFNRSVSRP